MVQRYEQTRKLQWYKRGAAYVFALLRLMLTCYSFDSKYSEL